MKTACLLLCILTALTLQTAPALADPGEFAPLYAAKGEKAREIIEKPTLYRSFLLKDLPCDTEEFEFLIGSPRLSMALAILLDPEVDQYKLKPRPDGSVHVDDSSRLVGEMELVSAGPGRRLYYIKGYWKFLLGITFNGRMALVNDYAERAGPKGPVVDVRSRGYMKIDNAFVGAVAKLIVFLFPKRVDERISRFANAVSRVVVEIDKDPKGVYDKLAASGMVGEEDLRLYRVFFLERRGKDR